MRPTWARFGFRGKVFAGVIFTIIITVTLLALTVTAIVAEALSNEYKNRGRSIALNLAVRSQEPILATDFLRISDLIHEVMLSDRDISYAFVLDKNNEILAHTFQGGFPVQLKSANNPAQGQAYHIKLLGAGKELIYDFAVPVVIGDRRLGTVRLGLLRTKVERTLNGLLWTILLFAGISTLVAGLAGAGFAERVTKRIRRLHHASDEASRGNLDFRAAPSFKKKCWEIVKCHKHACPAYGNTSIPCWYIAGTMCLECTEGEYAKKIEQCQNCTVYLMNSGDEIEHLALSFDTMRLALKEHIARLAESKEEIEESERKYRDIFEASMDLIFVADTHGNLLDINQAGVAMLGYNSKEALLSSVNLCDLSVSPEVLRTLLEEVAHKGFVKDRECTLRHKSDRELQVLFSSTARTGEPGHVVGYDGVIKDITARRNIERQLLQADKLTSLGQLSAGVAHEINNPLGLILGYTQLLIRGTPGGSEEYNDLKTIEKHTRSCKSIVEAMLSFARRTETKRATIDINRAVSAIISVIKHQFELDNVQIKAAFDETIPSLMGDEEKLKQVFMNLVMNARQAIENSGRINISTRFVSERDEIRVMVQDTGTGIPQEIIDKIFDPFFTTKPVGEGTGLGLSVSYGIVQEHNGEILVESNPDTGTTFTVALPAHPDNRVKWQLVL